MNAETGKVYWTPEEAEAAKARGEQLVMLQTIPATPKNEEEKVQEAIQRMMRETKKARML